MKPHRILGVFLASGLLVAAGCEGERRVTSPDQVGKKPAAPQDEQKHRETLHKTTQLVLKLEDALQQGGVRAETTIPVADPLTQNAAAYRTTVGKIGGMAVEQAIQIRNAQSIADPKPLSYDEFMAEIIKKDKPDGLSLAMLPYYQEYAWDEAAQKLVVIEFPAKKEAYQKQQDKKLGRN